MNPRVTIDDRKLLECGEKSANFQKKSQKKDTKINMKKSI